MNDLEYYRQGRHYIIYWNTDDELLVVDFVHGSRNLEGIIQQKIGVKYHIDSLSKDQGGVFKFYEVKESIWYLTPISLTPISLFMKIIGQNLIPLWHNPQLERILRSLSS